MQLCVILCGLLRLSAVIQAASVTQDTGVRSATVGENVTLRCFYDSQTAMHFSWYRQPIGRRPKLLFHLYKYDDPSKVFNRLEMNLRFSVQRKDGINHLHIADVQPSDSATYYCGSSHSNMVEFGEGIFLSVEGMGQQGILQEPASETIQPGGSVTLTCTVNTTACVGGDGVYWFRHGSQQRVIHTHRDHCKPNSPPESHSLTICHLEMTNVSSLDAGTYYCAVSSSGKILFGHGSKLLVRHEAENQIRILFWLSIMRTAILLLFLTVSLLVVFIKRC